MPGINRNFFFSSIRGLLFGGTLKKHQVEGLTNILDFWEPRLESNDDRWLAYILGTAHHEVGATMQPIREYGTKEYFRQMYDITGNKEKALELGNDKPGDGEKYHGRGYCQLTGKANYRKFSQHLDLDLVNNPERALEPGVAVKILFDGMIFGMFTKYKLADFFNSNKDDWKNARRVVNGTDKWQLIEQYGKRYYQSISYTK